MAEEFDYAKYLSNLLIIQYHDKPKAIETIKSVGSLFPLSLILAVRDVFNIDTATGKNLDMLGKYLGVSRWYYDNVGTQIELTDEEFRMLIKFKAISNTSDASHYSIDQALYDFFGLSMRASSAGNMQMTFFITSDAERVVEAAIQQRAIPTPLGVEANKIVVQDKKFFGVVTYDNQYAFYKTGFLDYNDPDKDGEVLTYDKVEEIERQ